MRAEACAVAPVPLECALYIFGHFLTPSFFHMFCPACFSAYPPFVLMSQLESTRAQSIHEKVEGRKYVQQQNAKNTQRRDHQLLYFTNVSSNVTNNYPASQNRLLCYSLAGCNRKEREPSRLKTLPIKCSFKFSSTFCMAMHLAMQKV